MSGEGAIITVETRKKIHTIRADEVADLCDRRNGKPWESGGRKHRRRSRKADSYWRQFCEKSTIQCQGSDSPVKASTISVDNQATNKNRRERKRKREPR